VRRLAWLDLDEVWASTLATMGAEPAEWVNGDDVAQVCTPTFNMRSRYGVRVVNVLVVGRKTCNAGPA
jgi:hypothetical protein